MAPVTVRQFNYPEDYPRVLHLWERMEKGLHVGRSDVPVEIEKKLQRDPDLFLVAEAEGELVGAVVGGYDGRRGFIYHLAVASDFRGQGIASRLMGEVETRLRARGCLRTYLFVLRDNEEAMHFYEKHGWERMEYVYPYGKDLI